MVIYRQQAAIPFQLTPSCPSVFYTSYLVHGPIFQEARDTKRGGGHETKSIHFQFAFLSLSPTANCQQQTLNIILEIKHSSCYSYFTSMCALLNSFSLVSYENVFVLLKHLNT